MKSKIIFALFLLTILSFALFRWEKQVETRREVIGRWSGMSYPTLPERPDIRLDIARDGSYRMDQQHGSWQLQGRSLSLQPMGGSPTTLQLTEDGTLTDGIVDGTTFLRVSQPKK